MNRRSIDLDQVAAVVMEAHLADLSVIETLTEVFDVGPKVAYRYLRRARVSGRLDHEPVHAILHRGRPRQVTWTVCETCTTTWPCPPARGHTPPHSIA